MRTCRRALVALATILLLSAPGGAALAQDENADAPAFSGEKLVDLTVPSWALPEDLAAMVVGDWVLAAGTDVTDERQTSQANESMRNIAIVVTSGEFLLEPTADALVYRHPGTTPEVAPATEAVTLQPADAIFLPAVPADEVDPERHLRIANPGSEDATALMLHAHQASASVFGGLPSGLRFGQWWGVQVPVLNVGEWLAADEIHFRLERRTGDPGATYVAPSAPATSAFFVESGAVERTMRGPGGEVTGRFNQGTNGSLMAGEALEQTLTVTGDEPASLLVLTATPQRSAD